MTNCPYWSVGLIAVLEHTPKPHADNEGPHVKWSPKKTLKPQTLKPQTRNPKPENPKPYKTLKPETLKLLALAA